MSGVVIPWWCYFTSFNSPLPVFLYSGSVKPPTPFAKLLVKFGVSCPRESISHFKLAEFSLILRFTIPKKVHLVPHQEFMQLHFLRMFEFPLLRGIVRRILNQVGCFRFSLYNLRKIFVEQSEYLEGHSYPLLALVFLEEGNTNPHKIVVDQMGGSEDIFGDFSASPAPCVVLSETPESTFPTRG